MDHHDPHHRAGRSSITAGVTDGPPHLWQVPGDDFRWVAEVKIMTPTQAARALRVTTRTVRNWAHRGLIRFTHSGDRDGYIYNSDDIASLLDLCRGWGHPNLRIIEMRLHQQATDHLRSHPDAVAEDQAGDDPGVTTDRTAQGGTTGRDATPIPQGHGQQVADPCNSVPHLPDHAETADRADRADKTDQACRADRKTSPLPATVTGADSGDGERRSMFEAVRYLTGRAIPRLRGGDRRDR